MTTNRAPRRTVILTLGVLGAAALALLAFAATDDPVYTSTFSNLAVGGYDPVAFFTDGKPVKGKDEFEMEYQGATWRFASAEHLEKFRETPEKYAPQYGGYCAWAVAQGKTAAGDPRYWTVVDGKLYLNYSKGVQKRWAEDIPGHITQADANWPGLKGGN